MSIEHLNKAFKADIQKSSLKFILVALADYANEVGEAYPSIDTVCKKTALNKKTVQAGLLELQELGYLRDTGRKVGESRRVRVFQIDEPKNGIIPKTEADDPKNGIQNHQLTTSVISSNAGVSFETFWQAYGNKKSKPTAEKAWNKLTPEQQHSALDAIPAFKASIPDWHSLPYPASYLNQHRWEDDLTPAKETQNGTHKQKPQKSAVSKFYDSLQREYDKVVAERLDSGDIFETASDLHPQVDNGGGR